MAKKDEAISQIRKVRHIISEENGHDPRRLVKYYIELQKQHSHLVQFKEELTEPVQASGM
jgi:hypothetical protein